MNDDFDTLQEHVTDFHWSVYDHSQIRAQLSFDDDQIIPFRAGAPIPGTSWIVRHRLGQGGVGEVWEVEHERLQRKAAFKILHGHNLLRRGLAERMMAEGRLLGSMRHANIVEALDMGVLTDGRPYLVLELLDGRDLRAELRRLGVLSIPAALDIARQVLKGLSALHDSHVVHRDIKLENLFLCADGHVEILDLGAFATMGETAGERGPSLGTPRTMAPEQYAGGAVDQRTDLYALGIVLYELLTGKGPFDDVSGVEALRFAHCQRTPMAPSVVAPQFIPPEIDALVLRALAKAPEDRFFSAEAMTAEIESLRSASMPTIDALRTTSPTVVSTKVSRPRSKWTGFCSGWRKPFLSPAWSVSIALLALIVASFALGIATSRKLPRLDVDVAHGA